MRHRVDANHHIISEALIRAGAVVISMTGDPEIGFDTLVAYQGKLFIMEMKDGDKPPGKRALTDNERTRQAMLEAVGVTYHIVQSVEDALGVING